MNSNFKVGSTVKLKHTFENAEIVEIFEDGMLLVLIAGEIDPIPVDPDNILDKNRLEVLLPQKERGYNTHIPFETYGFRHHFLHAKPCEEINGLKYFELYFANISSLQLSIDCKFTAGNLMLFKGVKILERRAFNYLCSFKFDDLSSQMVFACEARTLTTKGTGGLEKYELRLKGTRFFKNLNKYYPLPFEGYSFDLINLQKPKGSMDIRKYTEEKKQEIDLPKEMLLSDNAVKVNQYRSKKMWEFNRELDLHIEKLTEKYHSMSTGQILKLQLNIFQKFLEDAVILGIDRVFVIHGIGKGKLKNEIATILLLHPEVKTFVNEFHPKYGFGATEIIFQ